MQIGQYLLQIRPHLNACQPFGLIEPLMYQCHGSYPVLALLYG